MDYNKLKYFVTVAEKRSISKAAKVLRRTQSAISQQVRKLEEELQTKLFERVGKQIILTPEGQHIFELGKEKLGDIDEQVDWVVSKGKNLKGVIQVGFLQDSSTSFPFFPLLANFRKKYPNITFEVTFETSSHIEEMLLENKLDMGLLINFKHREMFETVQLASARHILVTSKEYLEAEGPFHTIDAILDADLIDLDLNFTCLRVWVRKNFEGKLPALIHRKPVIVSPNHQATKEIIESGHGIAILPEYLIEKQLKTGALLRVMPQMKELSVWLDLAVRKARKPQLYEQLFMDYMKSSV